MIAAVEPHVHLGSRRSLAVSCRRGSGWWLALLALSSFTGCGDEVGSVAAPGGADSQGLTADPPGETQEGIPSVTAPPGDTGVNPPENSGGAEPPSSPTVPSGTGQQPPAAAVPPGDEPTANPPVSSPLPPMAPVPTGSSPPPPPPAPPTRPPPVSGSLGMETQCNGSDDDSNGVIDDVDIAGDGVCDCLAIAALGLHGEWGGGNVLSGWLAERIERSVEELEPAQLTAEGLAPYHLLIVRDVSSNHTPGLSFSAEQVSALWEWVRSGGGLMTLIGYSDATEIYNVNRLLEPFSLNYGSEQIVQGQGQAAPVSQWFEHPVSEGVERLGADNGYPVAGQGFTFAAEQGYDLGKAATIGDGHVLVWGDEWITYESEWLGDAGFQVARFWQNALRWLTRATECQVPPAQ